MKYILKKTRPRLLFSLVIAASGVQSRNAWSAEKPAKLAPVRIAYLSRSTLDTPFIIARDRGYCREEGLEPELIFMKLIDFEFRGLCRAAPSLWTDD